MTMTFCEKWENWKKLRESFELTDIFLKNFSYFSRKNFYRQDCCNFYQNICSCLEFMAFLSF